MDRKQQILETDTAKDTSLSKSCNKCLVHKNLACFSINRQTKNGYATICKMCKSQYYKENKSSISLKSKSYYIENKEKILQKIKQISSKPEFIAKRRKYVEKNKEQLLKKSNERHALNRDRNLKKQRQWYAQNKERTANKSKEWRQNNSYMCMYYNAKRRARVKQSSFLWLNSQQQAEIKELYQKAKQMNIEAGYIKYHVDHIVPINGKNVCGLHVPWNLQILNSIDNIKKRNNF